MNCEITAKRSDGSVHESLDCLATVDVASAVVNLLLDDDVSEVVVRKTSVSEMRDLEAFREILERTKSKAQIEAMRRTYEAIVEARRGR